MATSIADLYLGGEGTGDPWFSALAGSPKADLLFCCIFFGDSSKRRI